MKENAYNRLVLVGNGFDLAAGLKTSYKDFIIEYCRESLVSCIMEGVFDGALWSLQMRQRIGNIDTVIGALKRCSFLSEIINFAVNRINVNINYKHDFFKKLIGTCEGNNWVDIENEYYSLLMQNFNSRKRFNNRIPRSKIVELNTCLEALTNELNLYLLRIQASNNVSYSTSHMSGLIDECFNPLSTSETRIVYGARYRESPEKVLFLNFNYTSTVDSLLNNSFVKGFDLIHIHGIAGSVNHPIIFGYGDDTGKEYSELEASDDEELLKKIKSFQYPRTHNYHKLLNFIEGEAFEVYIVGHSCGRSDKTMLNTIFESPKCSCIKIFHFKGEEEHFYKRMAISRHFSNKQVMRKRVLPYDESAIIPQKPEDV